MAAAGPTIIFVCLLVVLAMASFFWLAFMGRSFFVVVQQTAAGTEEVVWPDEPLMDWIVQGAQFFWLVVVWFFPVAMVLRAVNPNIFSDDPGLFAFVAGLTLWFCFPIGALSTMSAGSRWAILNPKLIITLVRVAPVTLAFYMVSAIPVAAALASLYGACFSSLGFAPLAGVLMAAALLMYARLLGRVAWKLNHIKTGRKKKRDKPPRQAVEVRDSWGPPPTKKGKKRKRVESAAAREAAEPVPLAALDAERIFDEADYEPPEQVANAAATPQAAGDDPEYGVPSAYDVHAPDETLSSKPPVSAKAIVPDDVEYVIVHQHDPDKPPPLLLVSGIFEFPWLPQSARHWLSLTVLGTIVAGTLYLVFDSVPGK